jgi:hypothetical protein
MPRPNTTFNLNVDDIEVIEDALRFRASHLSSERLVLCEENPAHLDKIRHVEQSQRKIEEMLGDLHQQKVFYRPRNAVYVGG